MTRQRSAPGLTADEVRNGACRSAQVLAYVQVLDALCELDRADRAALRLVYWYGRTHAQVAAELHLTETEVHHCVARGLRRVADHLVAVERAAPKAH